MVKTVLPLSLIVLTPFLFLAAKSYAEVRVSQGNASVDVKINNNVNTGSQSNVSKDCNTSVKITVNGETKTYDSSDCNKDINVQSDNGGSKVEVTNQNGESKVEVNNNTGEAVKGDSISPSPTKEVKEEIKDIVKNNREEVKKAVETQQKNFFAALLDSLFSFFTLKKES